MTIATKNREVSSSSPNKSDNKSKISFITVLAGTCKDGSRERLERIIVKTGETLAIVGPTGSGKSEFLSDIEQLACGDTISGRQILINDESPDISSFNAGLVAQLTQKTSFIMDCSVSRFLTLHAQSRQKNNPELVEKTLKKANTLSGEPMGAQTNLQVLSGGQSRALMIADIAYISDSPVILIDEIENAGIDKLAAIDILMDSNKPILISTHDPVLMLMVPRRLIMKNGGMDVIRTTSEHEKLYLEKLKKMDAVMTRTRHQLRNGEYVKGDNLHD